MNTILWIAQVLLAAGFLYSGICKTLLPEQQLIARGQTGVVGLSAPLIKSIGAAEILGSLGIILPWWTGILPVLTPVSAFCFAAIMTLAAPIHYKLKEPQNVAINFTFFVLSLLVVWGRGL